MNAAELKAYARERGADLVGIAPAERFAGLPAERSPLAIFPECRSVVVLGRRILRGALRGVEEGTNFSSTYGFFGFRWLEDNFLARTTYDVTCHIEAQGFEGVPLFGYSPDGMPTGRPVAPGKPAPNVIVDLDFAAQAAGLGEVGLGEFFLTPEFGPRQRFALVLTDMPLEPDPVRDKSICGDCGACAEACPFGAIDLKRKKRVGVPGHTMEVATVDYSICRACPNGAMMGPGRGSRPDRLAAACARACLVRLEEAGKCANAFQQSFRKRKPWALDAFHRPVEGAPSAAGSAAHAGCGATTDTIGQNRG
ncbi:MAG: 4Fe-4S dicluster domain-containing protein [Armatimonadota bacterium]|nr:4Fe-4S dicluster domain-containing protein [Armatimonadota bacterium]